MALGGTENSQEFDLEILEDQSAQVQDRVRNYQRKITQAYNKLVRARNFQESDLVLKAADHIMKGMHAVKFTPNWEGPYQIADIQSSGYCTLKDLNT
ncbi:hypothetical protein TorRG33x02_238500, partial [Trema orientale]